jgi:transformation/transcription domain-associated protein
MKQTRTPEQMQILRTEILTAIQDRWVPNTIVLSYFQKIYPNFEDFWLFRRQFSYQFAAVTFMTYVMHISNRYPSKLSISRSSGDLWASELIPALNATKPFFYNPEQVHFRLTPNLQTLMGPLAMEGIFAAALMAIARCLTEPSEQKLEQQLSIFVRDEMIHWAANNNRVGVLKEDQLREAVSQNTDAIVRRALGLARTPDHIHRRRRGRGFELLASESDGD